MSPGILYLHHMDSYIAVACCVIMYTGTICTKQIRHFEYLTLDSAKEYHSGCTHFPNLKIN